MKKNGCSNSLYKCSECEMVAVLTDHDGSPRIGCQYGINIQYRKNMDHLVREAVSMTNEEMNEKRRKNIIYDSAKWDRLFHLNVNKLAIKKGYRDMTGTWKEHA